jgi:transcriptional regulator with XRE-family HTH domain
MFLVVNPRIRPDPALGAAIRRLREAQDVTREMLAFDAGITIGSLARIELSRSVPGWDTVRQIADALGISIAALAEAVEAEYQHDGSAATSRRSATTSGSAATRRPSQ